MKYYLHHLCLFCLIMQAENCLEGMHINIIIALLHKYVILCILENHGNKGSYIHT